MTPRVDPDAPLNGRIRVPIRVIPRAGRDEVGGTRDGALVVRVRAAAVDGAANAAAARVLGSALGVPAAEVRIERGARSRSKLVSVPLAAADRLADLK